MLKLKMAILEKYPTQADFCSSVEIRESRLSQLIKERREQKEAEIEKICKKLGCARKDIFPQV